jgi:RNA ligase (TIGR02306 family)
MNLDRKLATVRVIQQIKFIEGADKICAYRVDGWWVVDAINKYNVGDLAVYLEVDSWVPHSIAPFLSKGKEPKEFEGIKGERLRTIKLKGQVSQGLLLPWEGTSEDIGKDLTEQLGITKYEKPLPVNLRGKARGTFPSFIQRTDQPRIQNVYNFILKHYSEDLWEVTEKLDGSSITIYNHEGRVGVCSRNIDLIEEEGNAFWDTAKKLNLTTLIQSVESIAIQGELIGLGIQGNPYGLTEITIKIFDVYLIKEQRYCTPKERLELLDKLGVHDMVVPTLTVSTLPESLEYLLYCANGNSQVGNNPLREGLVYKNMSVPNVSFKVISNEWLLKKGD